MIYAYRKEKYTLAALSLLETIMFVAANNDNQQVLMKYLLTIPGPAYTCLRYWDWIEPFIQ